MEGQPFDRSNCALGSRVGDDLKTAEYACKGCGNVVIGFGRWRNHMKRAKKGGGSGWFAVGDGSPASGASKTPRESLLTAHLEHVPAWESAPAEAVVPHLEEPRKQKKRDEPIVGSSAEGKAVWRLSGKEKRALAEAAGAPPAKPSAPVATREWKTPAKKPQGATAAAQPASNPPQDESDAKPLGKRWLNDGGKSGGKLQRKFF